MIDTTKNIVLYDGDCGFCNFWVQWILDRDHKDQFNFASLQSDFGQDFLHKNNLESVNLDTLYLLEQNGKFRKKLDAVIKIGNTLGGILIILNILKIFPQVIKDSMYDLVARNRKKIGTDHCVLPTPEQRKKFIL
ncbi:thiol-disulfide oxidoreductase DCC family protein [Chryseobacterium sp.]|uniref:thiol-disulfide oxidoreductase DCC family protein n=1 Tax=Chryseobacterium sp. TaxID=1871047 RepID=UPI00388D43BC